MSTPRILTFGVLGAALCVALAGCHQTPVDPTGLQVATPKAGQNGNTMPQLESGIWTARGSTAACRWSTTNPAKTGTSTAVTLRDGQTFTSKGCGYWGFVSPGQWTPGGQDMAAAAGFHVPLRDVLAHLLNVRATVRGAADETLTTVAP